MQGLDQESSTMPLNLKIPEMHGSYRSASQSTKKEFAQQNVVKRNQYPILLYESNETEPVQ